VIIKTTIKQWLLLVALMLVSVSSVQPTVNAQTITVSRYSYLTQLAAGQLQLNQINPLNLNESFPPIPIATGSQSNVFMANSSPDGMWITIWSYSPSNLILQLYNVNTAIVTTVIQVNKYEIADDRNIIPIWSPSSQYFAFNVYNASLPITYLFSTSNLTLTTIATGTSLNSLPSFRPTSLAWSSDNTRLAVVEVECYNYLCTNNIKAFAMPGLSQLAIIKIDASAICRLEWSPNNTKISFLEDCDYATAEYLADIFIWEVGQSQISRLTTLTNPVIDGTLWTQTYSTMLDAIWYDTDKLLIGAASLTRLSSPISYFAETALYSATTGRVLQLSGEVAYDWVRNPISGEYAYRSVSVASVDEIAFYFSQGTVRIGTFNGTNLSVSVESPNQPSWGQGLSWSPDGRFVEYSRIEPQGYMFLDKVTGIAAQYTLPVINDGTITVGWIVVD
jgi:hypothetical protein